MPLTTRLTELDLSRSDIEEGGERQQASNDSARSQAAYVTYGNKTFGAEPEDLVALADTVRGSATVLDTSPDPVLSELPHVAAEATE